MTSGRGAKPGNTNGAKLDWREVREIRRLYHSGKMPYYLPLAKRFGVSRTTIGDIIRNQRWVEDDPEA